jgi:acyl-CoA synthetase (NDP forming)
MAGAPLVNLRRHGYQGAVYAVNPRHDEVAGFPCFPDVSQLPEVPDTAVLVVPADAVCDQLANCEAHGIQAATIIASGFGEGAALEAGQRRAAELEALLERGRLRIVGPNTAGLINVLDSYVPRAAVNHPLHLPPGDVAIVTQSGALSNTLCNLAVANGVGLSAVVGTGDEADLDMWDVIDYLLDDGRTRAVCTVIEGIRDPQKFLAVARRAAAAEVPIIALKIGTSELGRAVVETHSGAIAGAQVVQSAVFREERVIEARDLDQVWEIAMAVQRWGVPRRRTSQIGVISLSGGEAAIAADWGDATGLTFPEPSETTASSIQSEFSFAKAANPFDPTGEILGKPEKLATAVGAFLADEAMDAVLVAVPFFLDIYAEPLYRNIALAAHGAERGRVAVSSWTAGGTGDTGLQALDTSITPVFGGVHRALSAIALYSRYGAAHGTRSMVRPVEGDGAGTRVVATYWQSRTALDSIVPLNAAQLVENEAEARAAAEEIGYPVTLKQSLRDSSHKLAAGALDLYLPDAASLQASLARIFGSRQTAWADGEGLVVEQYVPSLVQIIVGGHLDAQFGKFLLVGRGGAWAESDETALCLPCPFSDDGRREIAAGPIGKALRSLPGALDGVVELVGNVGEWFASHDDVTSFDLNPICVDAAARLTAVDARVEYEVR